MIMSAPQPPRAEPTDDHPLDGPLSDIDRIIVQLEMIRNYINLGCDYIRADQRSIALIRLKFARDHIDDAMKIAQEIADNH